MTRLARFVGGRFPELLLVGGLLALFTAVREAGGVGSDSGWGVTVPAVLWAVFSVAMAVAAGWLHRLARPVHRFREEILDVLCAYPPGASRIVSRTEPAAELIIRRIDRTRTQLISEDPAEAAALADAFFDEDDELREFAAVELGESGGPSALSSTVYHLDLLSPVVTRKAEVEFYAVTPGQDAVGIYAPAPSPGSRSWSGRRRTWFFNLRTGASLAGALELREVLDILTAPTRNNGTTRKLR